FFSSRRRHTRCLSDWSSDVCFSDLREFVGGGRKLTAKGNLTVADAMELAGNLDDPSLSRYAEHGWRIRSADDLPELQFLLRWARSEERRVGKERREVRARDGEVGKG